jgi:hypothetical protein
MCGCHRNNAPHKCRVLGVKKPKFSVCSQIKNHGHVKLNTSVIKLGKN